MGDHQPVKLDPALLVGERQVGLDKKRRTVRVQRVINGNRASRGERYALGTDRSLLWVIREKNAVMVTLPKRAVIEREVAEYRDTVARHPIAAKAIDLQRHATRLYELLLRSVREQMAGVENLIIVPDGILYYLPFETLYDGARYLIEDFTIGYSPSASVFGNLREAQARYRGTFTRQLIAFGDPVVSAQSGDALPVEAPRARLATSAEEVREIARLSGGRADIHLGAASSKKRLLQGEARGVPLLHLSTHATADDANPERSRILFSPASPGGGPDYLFLAAGTCGTLRGCGEYIRDHQLATRVVAVDAVGSVIFGPPEPWELSHRRTIPGHGAAVVPPLLQPGLVDRVVKVTDADCVRGCRRLLAEESILAGGSSGAVQLPFI